VDPTDPDPDPQHCSVGMNYKNRQYSEVTRNKQDITVKKMLVFLNIPPIQGYEEMISRFLLFAEKNLKQDNFDLLSRHLLKDRIFAAFKKSSLALHVVSHQRFTSYTSIYFYLVYVGFFTSLRCFCAFQSWNFRTGTE
jgi:hypothetical protein